MYTGNNTTQITIFINNLKIDTHMKKIAGIQFTETGIVVERPFVENSQQECSLKKCLLVSYWT